MHLLRLTLSLSLLLLSQAPGTGHAKTLSNISKKGFIQCGVSQGLPGFSTPDKQGKWQGIDVDFCRALAAAILKDSKKVRFTPLSAKERFTALQSGEVDLLSRNTTWTLVRDTKLGLDFAGVIYYDGQGFMVRKTLGVKSAKELDGATVCVNIGTTTELNVGDFFRKHGMKYKLVSYEKDDEVIAAYDSGRCDTYTTDQSGLYANRIKLKKPSDHMILPEIISKEPLGPVIRHGDDQWADIVRWTLYALIEAEELGVTSKNVAQMKKSKNPHIRRLLGVEGGMGKNLGLNNDWVVNMIESVGNYQEIFDRNLGPASPLKIARGQNALWNQGGLLYPMPVR